MSPPRTILPVVLLVTLGCTEDPDRSGGRGDAGTSGDAGIAGDAGSGECTIVDTTCPDEPPAQAAPCESGLSCEYTTATDTVWRYDCTDGLWVATNVSCGHDGICVPPLHHRCSDPFTGALDGLTVRLAPWSGPVRAFGDGEVVPLVWGPQGGAMVPFRVQLMGDGAPSCVRATVTATVDGTEGSAVPLPTAIECGLSQPILFIVPIDCGGDPEHAVDLHVAVEGVGEASASLTATGGDEPCAL